MQERDREKIQFLDQFLDLGILKEQAGDDIQDIYTCSQGLELPFLDYMTARDLLKFAGYEGESTLIAILMAMFSALQQGSLCLDLEKGRLNAGLQDFLDDAKSKEITQRFLDGLSNDRFNRLITRNKDDYLPLILDTSRGRNLLYFQKLYVHEKGLGERIEALLQAKNCLEVSDNKIESLIGDIFSPELSIRISKHGKPIDRDRSQVDAIRRSLGSQFSIISGGPGTGKTSLMVNILRCLVRTGIPTEHIIIGAPTGRAAQRMTEAVQFGINTIMNPSAMDMELFNLKGSTLHKILRYRSQNHDFYYRDTNPLPASAIILDEVSMVDVLMMNKFLKAVDPTKTKLIFLGDKDQLPSVEAGAVFAEMIPDGKRARRFKDRLILLEKVYRSGENLLSLAGQINEGKSPDFKPVSFESALHIDTDKWAFVRPEGIKEWEQDLRLWTRHHYLSPFNQHDKSFMDLISEAGDMDTDQLMNSAPGLEILHQCFAVITRARILSLVRNGIFGCIGINSRISQHLRSVFGSDAGPEKRFFSGTVIMVTRNDYSKELFNGDVGIVIRDSKGAYRAFFPRFDAYIGLAMDLLPPWEQAFAMTVHKSQGSEFDDVLLVLPEDEKHRLLTREIIYTGITRAKKRVVLYGTESVLRTACQRKIERHSGLMW